MKDQQDEIEIQISKEEMSNFEDIIYQDFLDKLDQYPEFRAEINNEPTINEAVIDFKNTGNPDAMSVILPQACKIYARATHKSVDDDIVQMIALNLLEEAIPKYSPETGVKFSTWWFTCAKNLAGQINRRNSALKRGGNKNFKNPRLVELKKKERLGDALNDEEFRELLRLENEAKNARNLSINARVSIKDSEVELGSLIEDKSFKNEYSKVELEEDLKSLSLKMKPKVYNALMMLVEGNITLQEIVDNIEDFNSAPAVFQAFKRLGKSEIGDKLKECLNN